MTNLKLARRQFLHLAAGAASLSILPRFARATGIPRGRFLALTAGLAALPIISPVAEAQTYPTRPVRWIVGYPAGGSADLVARLICQNLTEKLSRQFVIENRPGAGNNIATAEVVRAAADGYTLLLVTISFGTSRQSQA